MKLRSLILSLCLLAVPLFAPAQGLNNCAQVTRGVCQQASSTSTSATGLKLPSNGGLTPMFTYNWTLSPTGVTTTIKGCTTSGITPDICDTLDSYSGATATNRTAGTFSVGAPKGPYNYFLVTSTWTGTTVFSVYMRVSP